MNPGENQAVDATLAALRPLGLDVARVRGSGRVVLRLGGNERYQLRPVWAGEGYPSDVHRAIGGHHTSSDAEVLVIAARRLSRGGRRVAEEHGAGWVDLDGNARIMAPPGLLVLREAPPAAAAAPPRGWTRSALHIAEYVLARRLVTGEDVVPSVSEFGLDWSPSQIGKVLAFFDEQRWTVKGQASRGPTARRRLADPGGLLSAWAARFAGRIPEAQGYSVATRDVDDLAAGLDTMLAPRTWCVTGWLALDHYAPYATGVPILDVYVDEDAFATTLQSVERGDWRPVQRGARVRLIRAERHVLTLASPGAVPLASPIRVYGDLLAIGGRGEDAAAHLREVAIGF